MAGAGYPDFASERLTSKVFEKIIVCKTAFRTVVEM